MNERIEKFIQQHTCASFCCMDKGPTPYCFSCFYAFNPEDVLLYFKSAADSHHSGLMKENRSIAGTILPDKLNLFRIRGIQFEGIVLFNDDPLILQASTYYYKKFTVAKAMAGEIWTVRINKIKFTDNSLGFGKKLLWEREQSVV